MKTVTADALKTALKADPGFTPAQCARILALIRNYDKDCERPRMAASGEQHILVRAEVAKRFGRSIRFVDSLAKDGTLRRVKLPGRTRACGFLADEVDRLMTGEEVVI